MDIKENSDLIGIIK